MKSSLFEAIFILCALCSVSVKGSFYVTFIESDALWSEALIHLDVVYVSDCAASVSG